MFLSLIFINDTLSDIKGEFDVVIDIVVHTRISLINIIIFFLQILSGHLS